MNEYEPRTTGALAICPFHSCKQAKQTKQKITHFHSGMRQIRSMGQMPLAPQEWAANKTIRKPCSDQWDCRVAAKYFAFLGVDRFS
jgi:hypothetical protein